MSGRQPEGLTDEVPARRQLSSPFRGSWHGKAGPERAFPVSPHAILLPLALIANRQPIFCAARRHMIIRPRKISK